MGLQAYQCSTIIMFYLCLMAFINMLYVKGDIFTVGDSYGWDDFFDFNNWSDGKEFHVGDVLGKSREHLYVETRKSLKVVPNMSCI